MNGLPHFISGATKKSQIPSIWENYCEFIVQNRSMQTLDRLSLLTEGCFRESETDLFLDGVTVCPSASHYGVLSRQG